jgi:hypothetical protein
VLATLPTTLLAAQLEAVAIADRSWPMVPLFRPRYAKLSMWVKADALKPGMRVEGRNERPAGKVI